MLHGNPNAFCHSPLDTRGVERKDPDWVAAQRNHPKAKLMLVHRDHLLVERLPQKSYIQWLTLDVLRQLPMSRHVVLLGTDGDAPVFAVDASAVDTPPLQDYGSYVALRSAAPFLSPEELSIAGQALWLLSWHRRMGYCSEHGDPLISGEGGFKRVNERRGTEHFPRTDPVAIVLPIHDDAVCLGRGPHFPKGFMSAFAGYLEPGETLEQCGARELKEEVGLEAVSMRYLFSQPWPFPSSLMMGFLAEVKDRHLTLDPDEIVEARWFSREEAQAVLDGDHEVMCPPPFAIAHQLLKTWLQETR
ncbi:MAG: NAD(+) diphosphatase [Parvularcula sp.]|jgi:NAD+ diphosphatase|nr:NAD(+) diphosphatase [Parvularcula sp.]